MALGQEAADRLGDEGCAPQAAADQDLEARLAGLVAAHLQADIVDLDRRPVARRAGDRDLELAWQERELRVQARPLADQLGIDARVLDLLGGDAGVVIGGDVADAVAAGLQGVHLDPGQLVQQVGHPVEPGPVVLNVLARGEVAVALVVAARDIGEGAHLPRREGAVGNRDPQHVGVELEIEPIHQAQGLEFLLAQLTTQSPGDLAAELGDPLAHQSAIEFVVAVHGFGFTLAAQATSACLPRSRRTVGPRARIASRWRTGRGTAPSSQVTSIR